MAGSGFRRQPRAGLPDPPPRAGWISGPCPSGQQEDQGDDNGRHPDGCTCQFCQEDEREERARMDRQDQDDEDPLFMNREDGDWDNCEPTL